MNYGVLLSSACFSITIALRSIGPQIKNLLKKRNQWRTYYIASTYEAKSEINTYLLNAYFVTGFADAESSFVISIHKNKKLKIGWEVRASFQISLHQKDLALLKLIRNYFNDVGNIYKKDKDIIHYQVNSIQDLIHVIIPHFDIQNPYWLAGFTSGDGSFYIDVNKDKTKLGETARLVFKISQHSKDEKLMRSLVNFFSCGRYVPRSTIDYAGKLREIWCLSVNEYSKWKNLYW